MSQTQAGARRALVVIGMALLCLLSGLAGWYLGAGDPAPVERDPFEAVVRNLDDDGRRGCLEPVDPTVLRNFGGSVCGQIFLAAGTDASQGSRVRVRWFTTARPVGGGEEETLETFILQPNGPKR